VATLETILGDRLNISVLRWLAASRGGLTGNGIAKRLGAHQSSIRKALERLVTTGVVTRRDFGRSAAYALDENLAVVRKILIPMFGKERELWEELQSHLRLVATTVVPPARSIILFGSGARGQRDPQDIDLLVITPARTQNEKVRDLVIARTERISRRYGLPIGLIVMAEPELAAAAHRKLVEEVKRDGVRLAGSVPRALTGVRRSVKEAHQKEPMNRGRQAGARRRTGSGI
jgi:predicted nucleotidyltransferase